jgi:hypothetical protein
MMDENSPFPGMDQTQEGRLFMTEPIFPYDDRGEEIGGQTFTKLELKEGYSYSSFLC